jgi:hypothetical protein
VKMEEICSHRNVHIHLHKTTRHNTGDHLPLWKPQIISWIHFVKRLKRGIFRSIKFKV